MTQNDQIWTREKFLPSHPPSKGRQRGGPYSTWRRFDHVSGEQYPGLASARDPPLHSIMAGITPMALSQWPSKGHGHLSWGPCPEALSRAGQKVIVMAWTVDDMHTFSLSLSLVSACALFIAWFLMDLFIWMFMLRECSKMMPRTVINSLVFLPGVNLRVYHFRLCSVSSLSFLFFYLSLIICTRRIIDELTRIVLKRHYNI